MDNGLYATNAKRTLSVRPAQLGIKITSRDRTLTNFMHLVTGISTEVGELIEGMETYVTGTSRFTDAMAASALEEFGDVCYYSVLLAKMLKVSIPGAGRKIKLSSLGLTRTQALVRLSVISSAMLSKAKKVYYGPVMGDPKPSTLKEGAFVPVVDKVATKEKFYSYTEDTAPLLKEFLTVLWATIYDVLEVPPTNIFVANIAKLEKRYGKGFFDLSDREDADPDAEAQVMAEAAVLA